MTKVRYWIAALCLCGFSLNYILRTSINLAVVTMVSRNFENNTRTNPCNIDNEHIPHDYDGIYEWDEWVQGLITGSFFWGYTVGQIPGGRLADTYGAKKVYGVGMVTASILTLFIPLAADIHYGVIIAIRILIGLSLSPTFPATQTVLSAWAPPKERSMLATFVYSGMQIAPVVGFPFTASLIDNLGWKYVFYIQGLITLLWCVLWFLVMADRPKDFKWISEKEVDHIKTAIGDSKQNKKPANVPWLSMISSMPVWAVILGSVGHSWGYYTLLTDLPLYMKSMLFLDISSNALMISLPYIGQLVIGVVVGLIADVLLSKNILSTTVVRKTAQCFCQICPSICLLCLYFVECNKFWTLAIIFLAITLNGGYSAGYIANAIDISPNFAGTIFGIMNTFSGVAGLLAPMLVGALTKNQQTLLQWRKVFWITSAIYILEAIFYLIFSSSEEQRWNRENNASVSYQNCPSSENVQISKKKKNVES